MNRVAVIASTYFDFGKPPTKGGQTTPIDSVSDVAVDTSEGFTAGNFSGGNQN